MKGLIDSWLSISTGGKTLLNMDDCVYGRDKELQAIKQRVGKVDVLLSQFSYANWVGNPGDNVSHKVHSQRKYNEMARQLNIFQPSHFIPAASFLIFCHAENSFMNAGINRIDDVYQFISGELHSPSVVLYPADKWDVGIPWDFSISISKYKADYESVLGGPAHTSATVSLAKLQESALEVSARCKKKNNPILLELLPATVVRIGDLGVDVELSYGAGMNEVCGKQPDILIS
ncbi:MAG: hypothetical protein NVS9B4_01560 [Candidatus Acidiferrum sp.]